MSDLGSKFSQSVRKRCINSCARSNLSVVKLCRLCYVSSEYFPLCIYASVHYAVMPRRRPSRLCLNYELDANLIRSYTGQWQFTRSSRQMVRSSLMVGIDNATLVYLSCIMSTHTETSSQYQVGQILEWDHCAQILMPSLLRSDSTNAGPVVSLSHWLVWPPV